MIRGRAPALPPSTASGCSSAPLMCFLVTEFSSFYAFWMIPSLNVRALCRFNLSLQGKEKQSAV